MIRSKPPAFPAAAVRTGGRDDDAVRQRRLALARDPDGERAALALSGGGIRSATFSLGVAQAIAAAPLESVSAGDFRTSMLSKFDYLSTVSGGGYFGAFLCSLFVPGRLRDLGTGEGRSSVQGSGSRHVGSTAVKREAHRGACASEARTATVEPSAPDTVAADLPARCDALKREQAADDAVAILRNDAPGRIRSNEDYSGSRILKAPLAWLRENGRYLLPTGSGDALYALALGLRNWLSLHWVIGTVLVALVSILMLLRALGAHWPFYLAWEQSLLGDALQGFASGGGAMGRIWWSTLTMLWLAPISTVGLALGAAFWLVQDRPDGRSSAWNAGVVAMALIGLGFIWIGHHQWSDHFESLMGGRWAELRANGEQQGEVLRMAVVLVVGAIATCGALVYALLVAPWLPNASSQRVALTRGLALTLGASALMAGLGLVDTAGQSLYLAATQGPTAATAFSPAVLAGALAWLGHRLAKADGAKLPGIVCKLPLKTLAGVAGLVIILLVGAIWAMLVHLMIWGGSTPSIAALFRGTLQANILGWMVGVPLAVAFTTGLFPGFINLSSLQPFYGSRLTRAYLGASNGRRFRTENVVKRSAAEPMAGDEVRMTDYYAEGQIQTLAPLHLINVCVNKTVDPGEQLVQRDRKGLPLAVLPCGLALDTPDVSDFPIRRSLFATTVDRPLTVGQWIGTSGAAFSTGIGRETTLGMSLLMGAANVRLGTWWHTGRDRAGRVPRSGWDGALPAWLRTALGVPFRTQRYLLYELQASFHGTNRSWQYLSDGGHFENTALYELLRPHRRITQIFASDNGADPNFLFEDLANLIRLARIDLGVKVEVSEPPVSGPLAGLFARPEDFHAITSRRAMASNASAVARAAGDDVLSAPPAETTGPVAVLLHAWAEDTLGPSEAPTQIVLIKPFVTADAPTDVRLYAATHPSFPQEPTADQFFDEAQWESYRALGLHQAGRIFKPEILQALEVERKAQQDRRAL